MGLFLFDCGDAETVRRTLESIPAAVHDALAEGFHIVEERVTALPFEVVFESTGRSRLIRGLGRFYHGLAKLWPGLFAYQHILEAEIITFDEESIWS